MADYVQVDVDEIRRRSEELAARLGVRAPDVESGGVPPWCVNGLRLRRSKRRVVLVVGDAFDGLSAFEQEGALAYVVAAAGDVAAAAGSRNSGFNRVFRLIGFVVGVTISLTFFLAVIGSPAVMGAAAVLALSGCAFVVVSVVWTRRMIYRTDQLIIEVMGRPTMDMLFARERRGPRPPGVRGLYSRVAVPSDRQRLERIDVGVR
ncbi:hypothetical protein [Nocardia sp. NPDC056000]|uniref:hypothetical protein n=1 Tax=Nocardia sp. NPDC056000 TaxID=3345674 RepID=UPI0035E228FC